MVKQCDMYSSLYKQKSREIIYDLVIDAEKEFKKKNPKPIPEINYYLGIG